MSKKTSIYLNQTLERIKDQTAPPHGMAYGLTYRLERYEEICRRHQPYFSKEQWQLLIESLGRVDFTKSADQLIGWLAVAKDRIDDENLIARLEKLSFAEAIAMIEVLEAQKRGQDQDQWLDEVFDS